MSLLKRQHNLAVPSLENFTYPNLKRLLSWMLGTIPANFEDMDSKERRIFSDTTKLTSSADFIKAVRAGQVDEVKRILAINVSLINFLS